MFFVPPDLNATISELSAMRLFRETPCAAAPSLPPPHAKITGIILWFFNGIYSIGLPLSQDIYEGSAIERQGHRSTHSVQPVASPSGPSSGRSCRPLRGRHAPTKSTSTKPGGGSVPVAKGPDWHRPPHRRTEPRASPTPAAGDEPHLAQQRSMLAGLTASRKGESQL